jgi:hypothetical protein
MIELPCYGIQVMLTYDNSEDQPSGIIKSDVTSANDSEHPELSAAMDAVESMILAHACAGVDIETPAYIEGIETAINACSNRYS